MTDYDVIVCGLGPVGQLLALLLGDQGVSTLAIDREPEPHPLPRAAVIDDEVLRILQAVALDAAVLADAQVQRPSVEVRRGLTLEALDRRPDAVDAIVQPTGGGPSERIAARWLVGCDGAASAVRTQLEIPFEGRTCPQRWVVFDGLVDR